MMNRRTTRAKFMERVTQRREEAFHRQEERNKRTPQEQMRRLKERGHTECKEYERLELQVKLQQTEKKKKDILLFDDIPVAHPQTMAAFRASTECENQKGKK